MTTFFGHCNVLSPYVEKDIITNRDARVLERKLMMSRCQNSVAPPHIWRNNHNPYLQPQILGIFHHPNPKYNLIMETWELNIGPTIS
jgi:hypothetical protein